MINVMMHGCNGKMGQVISTILKDDKEAKIVCGVDLFDDGHNDYPVFNNIQECDVKADVIIDFCNAGAVNNLLEYAVSNNIPVVLCTTGLSDEQITLMNEASKKIAILKSANMSLGVNVIMKLLKEAAKKLVPAGFDIEIVEKHHNLKVDAPSGTAIALADSINEEFDNSFEYIYDRSGRREKRDSKELGISAVRGGSIVGDHDVIFAGLDEVITFSHRAYSKSLFAKGAISAAKFLAGKGAGLYDMQQVIADD